MPVQPILAGERKHGLMVGKQPHGACGASLQKYPREFPLRQVTAGALIGHCVQTAVG